MGFFKKSSAQEARSLSSTGDIEFLAYSGLSSSSYSGLKALRNSDVRKAIQTISDDISSSKILVTDGKSVTDNDIYYSMLNVRPNKIQDAKTFWFAIVSSMLLYGNSYAEIQRTKEGRIEGLQFLPIRTMNVNLNSEGTAIESYTYTGEGTNIIFKPDDILHFKMAPFDGLMGESPLLALAVELDLLNEAQKLLLSVYRKGTRGSGKVTIKGTNGVGINTEGAKKIRKEFEELNAGSNENALGLVIVDEDKFDYADLPIDTGFLSIINNITFEQKQIAKAFNLPIEKFGLEAINSSSAELNTQYVQNGLRHYMKVIEAELSYKLLGATLSTRESFEFDKTELTEPDFKELSETVAELVKSGIITTNEARAKLGYSPLDAGDTLVQNTAFQEKGAE